MTQGLKDKLSLSNFPPFAKILENYRFLLISRFSLTRNCTFALLKAFMKRKLLGNGKLGKQSNR
eukprot:snap_masked-scaffold_2-processed-gene-27.59-mRNA-1 protein AED:1.00 eAED:1.00 QI:0/0/0/0/1/1/2/0/63